MKGLTCLVTGAEGGLGAASAISLELVDLLVPTAAVGGAGVTVCPSPAMGADGVSVASLIAGRSRDVGPDARVRPPVAVHVRPSCYAGHHRVQCACARTEAPPGA